MDRNVVHMAAGLLIKVKEGQRKTKREIKVDEHVLFRKALTNDDILTIKS